MWQDNEYSYSATSPFEQSLSSPPKGPGHLKMNERVSDLPLVSSSPLVGGTQL